MQAFESVRYACLMSRSAPRVRIRAAVLADAGILLEWRNDPLTRRMSLQTESVSSAQHVPWLEASLLSPLREIVLGEDAVTGKLVGTCRFDIDASAPGTAEVSITVAPDARGRGYAGALLRAAIDEFSGVHPDIETLTAVIRPENTASIQLFEAAGFIRAGECIEAATYSRSSGAGEQIP